MPFTIDLSVNISVIFQTFMLVGTALIAFGVSKKTISAMEREMEEIKRDQKDLSQTVAQIAVQDSRIDRLEEDMRDLRRGRGFIVEAAHWPPYPPAEGS